MPDRPKHSHYNQDNSVDFHPGLAAATAEGRESLRLLRETPRAIFGTWLVRVAVMAAALWLADLAFGPFRWIWWAVLAYAVLSLAMGLLLGRLKNRQLDRIAAIYDQNDARHLR